MPNRNRQLFIGISEDTQILKLFPLKDTDLWGIESAIITGQQNGYFKDNKEWAEAVLKMIDELRKATGYGKREAK